MIVLSIIVFGVDKYILDVKEILICNGIECYYIGGGGVKNVSCDERPDFKIFDILCGKHDLVHGKQMNKSLPLFY